MSECKPVLPRLVDRLVIDGDCWTYSGARNDQGYAVIVVEGKARYVHRVAYELLVESIADGLQLDHLCRSRDCFNPDHLEPVTAAENMRRGDSPVMKMLRSKRCQRGHEFVGDNIYEAPSGQRLCRPCMQYRRQRANERKADRQ